MDVEIHMGERATVEADVTRCRQLTVENKTAGIASGSHGRMTVK
jgi:hypothetical protein